MGWRLSPDLLRRLPWRPSSKASHSSREKHTAARSPGFPRSFPLCSTWSSHGPWADKWPQASPQRSTLRPAGLPSQCSALVQTRPLLPPAGVFGWGGGSGRAGHHVYTFLVFLPLGMTRTVFKQSPCLRGDQDWRHGYPPSPGGKFEGAGGIVILTMGPTGFPQFMVTPLVLARVWWGASG